MVGVVGRMPPRSTSEGWSLHDSLVSGGRGETKRKKNNWMVSGVVIAQDVHEGLDGTFP